MDQLLKKYELTRIHFDRQETTPLYYIVSRYEQDILKIAELVQFKLTKISPFFKFRTKEEKNRSDDLKPPQYSIDMILNGPREKIFELYFNLESLFNQVSMGVV